MTIVEMISLFDLVEDKVDTIYFSDAEKLEFLNASQRIILDSIIFSNIEDVTADTNKKIEALLYTIIEKDVVITPASGNPTHTEIDAAITNSHKYILSTYRQDGSGGTYEWCKWVRENEKGPHADNTFKISSAAEPWVEMDSTGLIITPVPADNVKVSVVRSLADMVNPTQDCELPDALHEKIVAKALGIAGIASEDNALLMMAQLTQ